MSIIYGGLKMKKLILLTAIVLIGCQPVRVDEANYLKATEGYSAEDTNKLFVVDCLLPSQIRKLGSQVTYLTARRPIKTTAGNCEMRGGEYVAYDRSNYASALKVWLPQAKSGDVKAQVMVGEIYEKGLGSMADPAMAFMWYKKAALKGDSNAQINLGHLYEKGLGVKKNLPKALNWYRKASGLENTDLEFASVTETNVAASYEQKLQKLRDISANYQQQANALRVKLNQSQKKYNRQKNKLQQFKKKLEHTQKILNQEKNSSNGDLSKIRKLKFELQSNQASYQAQKIKLAEIHQDNLQASSIYHKQLKSFKQQLKISEEDYFDIFVQIKREMKNIEANAKTAKSTQDKLSVEQMRNKLKTEKANLLALGKQIKQLKKNITETSKITTSLENEGGKRIQFAQAGIEIIEPAMILTRGIPSYQLRSITASKKVIGRVSYPQALQSLTVNGISTKVDDKGVFHAMVDIKNELNAVEIIANYNKTKKPSVISFNLLAKGQFENYIDYAAPTNAIAKSYPSIDFGRFYALIIGNKDYKQLSTLKTSVSDAKAVEQILSTQYGYKTTLLINANRHQMMTAFDGLRKKLTEKDNLLIYYAGHGEIDKSDNSAYWLPTDAEPDNTANWLSSYSITQFINIINARHILVVADSCYSGAMTQRSIARLPDKISEAKRKKWLQFMVNRKARTIMTSGGVKPVLDSGGGQHSVFAKAFLTALRNNTGLMEDYELYRKVESNVRRTASLVGFNQQPQYSAMLHSGHQGSPYFFVSKGL